MINFTIMWFLIPAIWTHETEEHEADFFQIIFTDQNIIDIEVAYVDRNYLYFNKYCQHTSPPLLFRFFFSLFSLLHCSKHLINCDVEFE